MAASVRNTAIKRIQGDVREMMTNPSDQYAAAPLETNMFDWHFTLRGPRDTEFEGGIYHGRILLPSDYPFKPPNIILLTPNGRFEVKKKICLSISAYHPEEWQPAWGVRLILEALISFMPTKGEGAIGALDFPADERRRLAKLSIDYTCDVCGRVADLLPELEENTAGTERNSLATESKYATQIAQLHMHSLEGGAGPNDAAGRKPAVGSDGADAKQPTTTPHVSPTERAGGEENEDAAPSLQVAAAASPSMAAESVAPPPPASDMSVGADATADRREPDLQQHEAAAPRAAARITREPSGVDAFLQYLTYAIVIALFALVYKKMLQMHGVLQ